MLGKGALRFRSAFIFLVCLSMLGVLGARAFAGPADMEGAFSRGGSIAVSPGNEDLLPAAPQRDLGEFLREDGTIDLARGFRGSLNAQGYRLASAPGGVPRFEPAAFPADRHWSGKFGLRGVDGDVYAVAVDGAGNLYAGGSFKTAGGNNIARFDGKTWSALGGGTGGRDMIDSRVYTVAVDGSGNVYIGGWFTSVGGVAAKRIAKWDGTSWSALGSGIIGTVEALAVDGNGNLYAGGDFTTAGGKPAKNIAKWDGTRWSRLGSGTDTLVSALAVQGDGSLYVGGYFREAGGKESSYIAIWAP